MLRAGDRLMREQSSEEFISTEPGSVCRPDLKGEKAGEISIPQTLLAKADELIE
jgi:hypothetical protein